MIKEIIEIATNVGIAIKHRRMIYVIIGVPPLFPIYPTLFWIACCGRNDRPRPQNTVVWDVVKVVRDN